MATLSFHGATETVTGSKYLLTAGHARVMVDCGLFQGLKHLRELNWKPLPFDPAGVGAVVLTHAHIDHTGYLPRLVKDGFKGPVYCTQPTKELTRLLLLDSSENQERDADYANRKGFTRHKPALPLYEKRDVDRAVRLLKSRNRGEWFSPVEPFWFRYYDAGHLLGSNFLEVEIRDRDPALRLVFSGDVGRYDAPLYFDPAPPPACDLLICESTYGGREHSKANLLDELAAVVHRSVKRGGVMLVASFAVGRAQQLIYLLQVLKSQRKIPDLPIYLDSPMAVEASEIYCRYADDQDLTEGKLLGKGCVLHNAGVHFTPSAQQSREINRVSGPAIIIASSGMMTGGRILHHLKQRLSDSRNTVLLGGYQAEGTRGRRLQNGEGYLKLYGADIPVRAAIEQVSGLSGHADHGELLRWLKDMPAPKHTFLTHGEYASAAALADALRTQRGWEVSIPKLGESLEI